MLKKTIKYTDFNGEAQSEVFYFNITKAELVTLSARLPGGIENYLNDIMNRRDGDEMMNFIEKFILMSIGQKSPDGKKFVKSAKVVDDFKYSPAYDELFLELLDPDKLTAFIKAALPVVENEA